MYTGGGYVLQVAFDRTALPVRCRRFTRATASASRGGLVELTLNGHGTAHLVEQEIRAGLVGVLWDWE
jgi:hypothetical protein